jgi:toxin FitB
MLSHRGEEDALQAIGIMSLGFVADVTREIALEAACISVEHKMAMADSIILATARAYHAVLWTQDVDFKGLEGVQYIEKK